MTAPLSIAPIDPKDLHAHWPLVRRGIENVIRKIGKSNVDFIPEDCYAGIRAGGCALYLVSRGTRSLGFFLAYPQQRPFSGKKELFLWIAWNLPLRERLVIDDIPEAMMEARDFLVDLAVKQGCDSLCAISSRRGFEKWGFKRATSNWRLWLTPAH